MFRCNENTTGMQLPTPLQAPTVEVQRDYGTVEVESVLTVGLSNRRMTVECVAFNLVGVSSDTLAMEVSGEDRQTGWDVSQHLIMCNTVGRPLRAISTLLFQFLLVFLSIVFPELGIHFHQSLLVD